MFIVIEASKSLQFGSTDRMFNHNQIFLVCFTLSHSSQTYFLESIRKQEVT